MKTFEEQIIALMLMELVDNDLLRVEEAELDQKIYLQNEKEHIIVDQKDDPAA